MTCKEEKETSEFYLRKGRGEKGYRSQCKICHNKNWLEKSKKERTEVNKAAYRYTLRKLYGVSEDQFNTLFEEQRGKCKICETPITNRFLDEYSAKTHLDHCHRTGVVRGILCHMCNSGLGLFNDDPDILRKAADYVEKFRGD